MMHIHTLYKRQCHMLILLKQTNGTVEAEQMFQNLQQGATRQFGKIEEHRHFYFLPQNGEQCDDIQRALCKHRIILEEGIQDARMIRIQQKMQLCFRIDILQSENNHQQYQISDTIYRKRLFHILFFVKSVQI